MITHVPVHMEKKRKEKTNYTNNLFKLTKLLNLAQKGSTLPSTSQYYSIAHAF